MFDKFKIYKMLYTLIGVLITGISIGLFRYVGMGIDPYSTMVNGISNVSSVSYGTIQMCCASILFLFQFIYYKKSIGLGTALNLFFIGYISDIALLIFNSINFPNTYIFKLIWILSGVVMIGIGMGIYTSTNLGIAPYDSAAFIISYKKNISFSISRIMLDLICLLIGMLFGAPIGITTVIMMLATGPLVSVFSQIFMKKILC